MYRVHDLDFSVAQANAIPLALAGRDLMVVAQTGSGKTLTFLLPILQKLTERGVQGSVSRYLARFAD